MNTPRNYPGKNEEIIAVCEFAATRFERDQPDFILYSPKFGGDYLKTYQTNIQQAREIIFPIQQTKELKVVTARLYANMDKFADLLDRLTGYIKLSKKAIPLTVKDFGITSLKYKIRNRNVEGSLTDFMQVSKNIEIYNELLAEQGLTEGLIAEFKALIAEINADNIKQFEIASDRRRLSEANINLLNALHEQLSEICQIGKILYKKSNPDKLPDYQLSALLKKARVERTKTADKTAE
jgi:hypothetical protein